MTVLKDVPEHYLKEAREAWALLSMPNHVDGGSMVFSVTDSTVSVRGRAVRYAVDQLAVRHVLVPISRPSTKQDHTCDGVWIDPLSLADGGGSAWYLDVSYRWSRNYELFSLFAASLLWDLASDDQDRPETAFESLSRWKALFSHASQGGLDPEAAIGLFGELWLLETLSAIRSDAVLYWTGPEGGQHDFQFPSGAMEVKTTRARANHLVWINGLLQLAADRPLALALVEVDAGAGETVSLEEVAARIARVTSNPQRLEALLGLYGVSLETIGAATSLRFTIRGVKLFEVAEGFPRILEDSFLGGSLPEGVRDVRYQVDLDSVPIGCHLEDAWLQEVLCR